MKKKSFLPLFIWIITYLIYFDVGYKSGVGKRRPAACFCMAHELSIVSFFFLHFKIVIKTQSSEAKNIEEYVT